MKPTDDPQVSRMEVLQQIKDILESGTLNPAEEMIGCGKAMMQVGEALKDVSPSEARAIMRAVIELFG